MTMDTELDTETVRYLQGEVDAMADGLVDITVRCSVCLRTAQYAPAGLRVTVLSSVGCYYEFFCLDRACRAYNKTWLDLEHATLLYENGVATRSIEVPAEVLERAAANEGSQQPMSEEDLHVFMRYLDHIEGVGDDDGTPGADPGSDRGAQPRA